MSGHVCVCKRYRVCLFLRFFYSNGHVHYMSVRGESILPLFLCFGTAPTVIYCLLFHLISITSTWIMKDIGGRGFDVVTYLLSRRKYRSLQIS